MTYEEHLMGLGKLFLEKECAAHVVIVQQGYGKYLFKVPEGIFLNKGDRVLCKTKRGITDGVCVSTSIYAGDNALDAFAMLTGAKFPLKPIVGRYVIENFETEE